MRLPILLSVLPFFCLSAGCINTDAAVFVEPSIKKAPEVTVSAGVLGIGLTGSFQLSLHLGPRATSASKVSLGTAEIVDAGKKGAIVAPLPVAAPIELPVTVELDSDVDVPFTFDTGDKPLKSELLPELCDPMGVVLSGAIQDSLQDHVTPFASAVFRPAGCM